MLGSPARAAVACCGWASVPSATAGRDVAATSGRPWLWLSARAGLLADAVMCLVCSAVAGVCRSLSAERSRAVGSALNPFAPPTKLTFERLPTARGDE